MTNLTTVNNQEVAQAAENYVTNMLENMRQDFIQQNAGLDLDFVHMGEWLLVDKKGNFVERPAKDDPKNGVNYGDNIDVVIAQGEQRWSLWGLDKSPEDGQLLVAEKDKKKAEEVLTLWLEENPQAASRYNIDMLEMRYMAYIVPVSTLGGEDAFPKVYLMSFSPTATITLGRWAQDVYLGKFKHIGIPPRTGINKIVTRLFTTERTSKRNSSQSWIGLDFEAIKVFNPKDFGIEV